MSLQRDQFISTVISNVNLCREHWRLVLRVASFPPTRPGQFIQVACRDLNLDYSPEHEIDWDPSHPLEAAGRELMSPLALLRRPFSLAGRRDGRKGVELEVIHRVVGVGTQWLAQLASGDKVFVLGPLGNHFTLPAAGRQAFLVVGGVGIPPMLYLAEALAGTNAVAFCGALTRDLLPLTITPHRATDNVQPVDDIAEFARHGIKTIVTTDDGSYGYRGFVTQALQAYLDQNPAESGGKVIYTCGPEGMMKRVAEIAMARGIECQVAVERAMACGMGTCQSCVIRVRKSEPVKPPLAGRDWCYRLACTDGPVFSASQLLW